MAFNGAEGLRIIYHVVIISKQQLCVMFWSTTIKNIQLVTALWPHLKPCHLAGHPHLLKASWRANSCTKHGPAPERMPRQNPQNRPWVGLHAGLFTLA